MWHVHAHGSGLNWSRATPLTQCGGSLRDNIIEADGALALGETLKINATLTELK